jgi:hypothetical protein
MHEVPGPVPVLYDRTSKVHADAPPSIGHLDLTQPTPRALPHFSTSKRTSGVCGLGVSGERLKEQDVLCQPRTSVSG